MNLIRLVGQRILDKLAQELLSSDETDTPTVSEHAEEEPNQRLHQGKRTAKRCPKPAQKPQPKYRDLEDAREELLKTIFDYLEDPDPGYILVITGKAGMGKTTAGVKVSHWVNSQGKRVLYAGPRHNFFADIIKTVQELDAEYPGAGYHTWLWREWLPRQNNQEDPSRNTCRYAQQCNTFAQKGYPADHFCRKVCTEIYMKQSCPYHAQAKTTEPIIFIQHQHIVSGHVKAPGAHVLIGDENPMSVFIDEIVIPADEMHFAGLKDEDSLKHIVHTMQTLAKRGADLSGYELMDQLNMDRVLDACNEFTPARLAKLSIPNLDPYHPEKAYEVGYNILPALVPLLKREAEAAIAQRARIQFDAENPAVDAEYNERIYIKDGKLTILSRNHLAKSMPKHIVWFDATGVAKIYEQMFGMKVKIYEPDLRLAGSIIQLLDRTNSKTSLISRVKADPEERREQENVYTDRAQQLRAQIERIEQKLVDEGADPAKIKTITYKTAKEFANGDGHFFGNRGTNAYADCDALIIAGTPMAPLQQIERLAKCLWYDEMERFDNTWLTVDRTYNYIDPDDGEGWCIPVNEYADPRLNALLWQQREAELIQSAHRARILFRDVPVYLLTNLPIDELPPSKLMTIRELMEAPDEVNVFKWQMVLDTVEAIYEEKGAVTAIDLVERTDVNRETADKYIQKLLESGDWVPAIVKAQGRGRPRKAISKA